MDLFLLGANLVRCVNAKVSVESLNVRDVGEILRQDLDGHTGTRRSVESVSAVNGICISFNFGVIVEMTKAGRPVAFPGNGSLAVPLGFIAGLSNREADFVLDFAFKIVAKIVEVADVILNQGIKRDAVEDEQVVRGVDLKTTDDFHESVTAGTAHLGKKIANGHVTTAKRCQIDFDVFYLNKFFLHKYLQVIVF